MFTQWEGLSWRWPFFGAVDGLLLKQKAKRPGIPKPVGLAQNYSIPVLHIFAPINMIMLSNTNRPFVLSP